MCLFKGTCSFSIQWPSIETADFESIRNIEKSEKFNKPLKIGKFGLGFNSVYHLTVSEV